MNINYFMNKAILEAKKAVLFDEVPIGAVIVNNDTEEIIALNHNRINKKHDATQHAEILVIQESCNKLQSKYLNNTSIFITLEPCIMCAAAISEVHIKRIYFGAYDENKGSIESTMKIYKKEKFYRPEVYGGISELECSKLLINFFKQKRK